jgi:hypothetical protein
MFCRRLGSVRVCALGTGKSCCTDRPARFLFMLEAHGPRGTAGRVVVWSPPRREMRYEATRRVAHQTPPNRSRATVHVAASEPSLSKERP